MAPNTLPGLLQLSVMVTYKITLSSFLMRENFVHGIVGNPRSRSATDRGFPTMCSWVPLFSLLAGTRDVVVVMTNRTRNSIVNQ